MIIYNIQSKNLHLKQMATASQISPLKIIHLNSLQRTLVLKPRNVLWRLFNVPVCVKGSKLLLNPIQWICKFSIVKWFNHLLDPFQEVRGQCFIVCDHLVIFSTLVDNLQKKAIGQMEIAQRKVSHVYQGVTAYIIWVI